MVYRTTGKRLLDLLGASVALIALSPVTALTALAVAVKLGRPVIFRQERAGRGGRPFTLYKFRSMTDDRDAVGNLLPDTERLESFGRMLRHSSLDELPTLLNVMSGDLSLVGPRPLHVIYNDRYSEDQRRRLDVKPGITGWAQVNGRNVLTWDERFELDVWYVDNVSLALDLKILARTISRVIRMQGVKPPGQDTMEYFGGLDDQARRESRVAYELPVDRRSSRGPTGQGLDEG